MRPIDADGLEIDMAEEVFDGDGGYKIFGYSKRQIDAAPTIAPQPNDPLTLEELRGMDGEPVWVHNGYNGWCTCRVVDRMDADSIFFTDGTVRLLKMCGNGWSAYRRRPEEGDGDDRA